MSFDLGDSIGGLFSGIGDAASGLYNSVFGPSTPDQSQPAAQPSGQNSSSYQPTTQQLLNTPVSAASQSGNVANANAALAPSTPSFLSNAWNTISGGNGISGLAKNLSPLIAGGGMLNSVLRGPGKIPQKANIQNNAAQLNSAAQPLLQAENTGQLAAGDEQNYDQQLQARIAQIKQGYASHGIPPNSSMEQQDIANAQADMVAVKSQALMQAVQTGANLSSLAEGDYNTLAQTELGQNKQLSDQLSAMMQAFAGGAGATKTVNNSSNPFSGSGNS